MIVLPNRLERYINALRIFTSLSVAKHGLQTRHVKNLAKIHLCEAFLFENERQITALKLLSHNLLSSVRTLKPEFDFSLESLNPYLPDCLQNEETKRGMLQLFPDRHNCDGFFLARLRRKE